MNEWMDEKLPKICSLVNPGWRRLLSEGGIKVIRKVCETCDTL